MPGSVDSPQGTSAFLRLKPGADFKPGLRRKTRMPPAGLGRREVPERKIHPCSHGRARATAVSGRGDSSSTCISDPPCSIRAMEGRMWGGGGEGCPRHGCGLPESRARRKGAGSAHLPLLPGVPRPPFGAGRARAATSLLQRGKRQSGNQQDRF